MSSSINPAYPAQIAASTANVRANFQSAVNEIEALQNAIGVGGGSGGTVDINAGAIDGTTIGAATAAAGTFTTCTATNGVLTSADINGGTIDDTTIGGTTPGAGTFSTLTATGGTVDGTTVGGTTPAAGTFTTLETTGAVVFNDAGADVDFRVEGNNNANLFVADAGNDRIGIRTGTPSTYFHLEGTVAPQMLIRDTADNDLVSIKLVSSSSGVDGEQARFVLNASSNDLVFQVGVNDAGITAPVSVAIDSPDDVLALTLTEAVFNDSAANIDFRVESSTKNNILFVDASEDVIGIGINSGMDALVTIEKDSSSASRANSGLVVGRNTGQQIRFGSDNSGKDSFIQATDNDVTNTPLILNPSGGPLGLGITPESNWATTLSAFQVGGLGCLRSVTAQAAGNATGLSNNVYWDTADKYLVNDEAALLLISNGQWDFYTATAAAADTNITWGNPKLSIEVDGTLAFGSHSAIGAETVTGFITIKDSGGVSRKLAVVS